MENKTKFINIRLNKISPEKFMKSFKRNNNFNSINNSKKIEFNGNISTFSTMSAIHNNKNAIRFINNSRSANESEKKNNTIETSKKKIVPHIKKCLGTKKPNYIRIMNDNNTASYSINQLFYGCSAEKKYQNSKKMSNSAMRKLNIISPKMADCKYKKPTKSNSNFNNSNIINNTNNLSNGERCNTCYFNLKNNTKPIKIRKVNKKLISINKNNLKINPRFHEKNSKKLNESNPSLSKTTSIEDENNIISTVYSLEAIKKDNFPSLAKQLNKLIKQNEKDRKIIEILQGENWKLKQKIKDFVKTNDKQIENIEYVNSLELKNRKLSIENERLNMEILKLKIKISEEFENKNNSKQNLDVFPINEDFNNGNKDLLERIKKLEDKFYCYSKNKS